MTARPIFILGLACLAPLRGLGQEPTTPPPVAVPAEVPAAQVAEPTVPEAATGIQARVAGIAVVRESLENEEARYRPFGLEPGTRLSLLFASPTTRLVAFDPETSRVDTLTDDMGTNLMALSNRFQVPGYLTRSCGILSDGTLAHAEIFGGTPPSAGATAVHARGVAVFQTASRLETVISPMIEGAKDATFQAGERFLFTATRWEKGGIGGKGITLTLSCLAPPASIQALRFMDAERKEIESRPAGVSVEKSGDDLLTILHYQLATEPKECAIEVTHWADIRPLEVPFFIRAGLGGGQ